MKPVVQTCFGAVAVVGFCGACLLLGFIAGQLLKAVLS